MSPEQRALLETHVQTHAHTRTRTYVQAKRVCWQVGSAFELIRFMLLVHFVFVSVELPRSHNNNSHVARAFRKGLQDHESVWPASAVNHIQPDLSWSLRESGSKVKQLLQTISHGKLYFLLARWCLTFLLAFKSSAY